MCACVRMCACAQWCVSQQVRGQARGGAHTITRIFGSYKIHNTRAIFIHIYGQVGAYVRKARLQAMAGGLYTPCIGSCNHAAAASVAARQHPPPGKRVPADAIFQAMASGLPCRYESESQSPRSCSSDYPMTRCLRLVFQRHFFARQSYASHRL